MENAAGRLCCASSEIRRRSESTFSQQEISSVLSSHATFATRRRQWLADLPAGKRALLAAENGALFLRFVAVLDAVLGVHVLAIEDWHTRSLGAGQHEVGRQQQAVELADLGSAIDNCSEVLKATASLMSLTT